MQRGLETLAVFERFCRANQLAPGDVHPIATSAIRDASNHDEFIARARETTGMEIEILSAQDEARYGYVAAVNTSTLRDGLVLDLGGGSMQLIDVRERRPGAMSSFPLGAVRLTERFLPGEGPAKKKDLARVREHVREVLAEHVWPTGAGHRLVALGGAARNLAAAAQGDTGAADLGVQGYVITADVLSELVGRIAALPSDERGSIHGVKPGRGDIILAAAVTLETVLELGRFDGLEVTEAGLRDGVFLARTLLGEEEPLFPDVREAAVRNLAIQYESDMAHVEQCRALSLQMPDLPLVSGVTVRRRGVVSARG